MSTGNARTPHSCKPLYIKYLQTVPVDTSIIKQPASTAQLSNRLIIRQFPIRSEPTILFRLFPQAHREGSVEHQEAYERACRQAQQGFIVPLETGPRKCFGQLPHYYRLDKIRFVRSD